MTQPGIYQLTPDDETALGPGGDVAAKRSRRAHPLLAWLVIAACVVAVQLMPPREPPGEGGGFNIALKVFELQGKYFVGAAQMTGDPKALAAYLPSLNEGGVDQRLRYVVLTGELAGADKAAEELGKLRKLLAEEGAKTTDEQRRDMDRLAKLYDDFQNERWQAPSLDARGRQQLRDDLGWFGALALAPRQAGDAARQDVLGPAQETVAVILLTVPTGLFGGTVGLAALVAFVVLVAMGKLRFRGPADFAYGGIFAETFAVWLLGFLGLSTAASMLAQRFGHPFSWLLGMFALSLGALVWPLLRGVPWRELCAGAGLRFRGAWREPLWGLLGYLASLPLLVGAVIVSFLLAAVLASFGPPPDQLADPQMPAHPAARWLLEAGGWDRLQIILLAVVAAPLIEETMFRGVLYGHLRAATAGWRVLASVAFSGLASGLVFAIIHPQGIIGVPPLCALAFSFAVLREWRGSLLAPMTAHALNNGIVMGMLLLLF